MLRKVNVATHTRRSRALLCRELPLFMGLSVCLHISFVASVCGVGLIAGPWFACELIALQLLGLGSTDRIVRGRPWIVAGVVFFGLQLLILTGVIFAWIGLTTSAPLSGAAIAHDEIALRPVLVFASTLIVALGVTIPLTFVPHHLLSREVSALQALGDGLRDVARLGFIEVYRLVLLTQMLQLAPFLVMGLFVTWRWGREAIAAGVLFVAPIQVLSLPLAQGVISSVYSVIDRDGEKPASIARWLDIVVVALPVLLCLLSVLSLLQPAPIPTQPRFEGVVVFDSTTDGSKFLIRDTDLALTLRAGTVHLETADGGGAGRVSSRVRKMVVEERSDAFVARLDTDQGGRALHFDRAGVRLDDSLSDRLAGHVPEWFFFLLMAAMVMSTWAVYRRKAASILLLLISFDLSVAALAYLV